MSNVDAANTQLYVIANFILQSYNEAQSFSFSDFNSRTFKKAPFGAFFYAGVPTGISILTHCSGLNWKVISPERFERSMDLW